MGIIGAICRRTARPVAAALIALSAAACSSMTSRQLLVSEAPKATGALAGDAERENQRVLSSYGGAYEDPKLQAKLAGIVERLVAASEGPEISYRITVLNSPAVNAFALPNGQLYVTRGLLGLANDASEVASVLSHEMAHVTARHAALREEHAHADLVAGVTDLLAGPPDDALALARSKLDAASFSRAQEIEADGIGVANAARSGYDPFGAARLLTSMGRNADLRAGGRGTRSPEFLSSHPATPERVKNAQSAARQYGAPGSGERDKTSYLASLDGIVYGEDPIEGFVRGRRFVHPKLGFTFTAPEGFTLDNSNRALLGLKDGGAQALRLDVVKVSAEQSLVEYLNSGWIDKVDPDTLEEVTVNGFPAATGTAGGEQWAFRLYAIRFGNEVYRFIFAAKSRSAETDRIFHDAIQTFHRLTPAEIQSAKPLRLKVVKVGPHDTIETLASRMALIDRQVERFRVLNGLEPGDRVAPGDFFKIIVE
jgi:predicted Zn-dependent protease